MTSRRWCIGVLLLVSATLLWAEEYDFGALKWRNIGPNRGGRSIAAAGSMSRPLEYYFGATGGGLWKTTDAGTTWRPVTDGQIKSSSVGAIAVSESNPDVVYIGTGETELRGNIIQGDGVYKSSDGGKKWIHLGLADTQAIARIRLHPTNPDLVYVAALGHPFGANEQRGVFRSNDGGRNWKRVLFRSNKAGAVDLSMDARNPKVLFASIWEAYRTPWTLSSGGEGSGLFRSGDGGDTWTEITRHPGLPSGILGKIGVAVSPADSNRVYALIEAQDGGLFRSDDAGKTWTKVSDDHNIRQRAFYYTRITADPKNRDVVYALNVELHRSTDGGKTWSVIRGAHSDHHDLWIAPNDPLRMMNANDGGGSVSVNGGATWTHQQYPTAQLYHVAVTRDDPYHVCGSQQDNTTACVTSAEERNRDPDLAVAKPLYAVGGGEDGYIATHPENPDIFFAGSQAGIVTRFDRKTGQTRDVDIFPLFFSGMPARDLKERWQWTFPIVFSPLRPFALYVSSQHLWKSVNEGQSWERISPDLTRADPKTLGDSGGPITKDQNGPEIYGTIFTVAPSRRDPDTVWTGSDDGLVYVTRDGGKNWKNITPRELPEFSRISLIDASPHRPGSAYVAAKRYQLDDLKPYVFRTDDYGESWTRIVDGIAPHDFVHVVREDSKRAGLLYAGSEHGVYVSFNNGDHWQSLSLDLPDTQIPDLLVEENDLVIATHGRSFYVLDDIDMLRQLTPEVLRSEAHLFQPADGVRPRNRVAIDYFLRRPTDGFALEILDASGTVIRRFSGKGRKAPAVNAGTNRFVWDLRYPGPTVFEGMILRGPSPAGPVAPPGAYAIRLTAAGQTQTRSFHVVKNPRLISSSDAELQEQFRFAMQVRDRTSRANEMVVKIRALKKQIRDRMSRAGDPTISGDGEALDTGLSRIEEEIYQVRNRSPRDTLNYPIKLNNQLAFLLQIVNMGDYKPTDQVRRVYDELSEKLSGLSKEFDQLVELGLKPLNDRLRGKNVEPIALAQ